MDDVIYRRDALDALTTECSWTIYDEHGQLTPNGEEILETLKKIPSADAVEVVRCEHCKYYVGEMFFGREVFWCNRKYKQGSGMMELTDADDFCSYGERKTDG